MTQVNTEAHVALSAEVAASHNFMLSKKFAALLDQEKAELRAALEALKADWHALTAKLIALGHSFETPHAIKVDIAAGRTPGGVVVTAPGVTSATTVDLEPAAPVGEPTKPVETVYYADGSSATGTAPLPASSPNGAAQISKEEFDKLTVPPPAASEPIVNPTDTATATPEQEAHLDVAASVEAPAPPAEAPPAEEPKPE